MPPRAAYPSDDLGGGRGSSRGGDYGLLGDANAAQDQRFGIKAAIEDAKDGGGRLPPAYQGCVYDSKPSATSSSQSGAHGLRQVEHAINALQFSVSCKGSAPYWLVAQNTPQHVNKARMCLHVGFTTRISIAWLVTRLINSSGGKRPHAWRQCSSIGRSTR